MVKEAPKEALQLAARFALPPNSLGYCGRDSAPERFNSCVMLGECEGVEEELDKFIVLHPYLKTISEVTGLPKYSKEVVEAYSIGNELLNDFKAEHYDLLLDNFELQGVPDWFVAELRETKPKKFIPHHLFQVLFVGVGKASGSVPYSVETINNCMVRWGEIENISDSKLTAKFASMKSDGEKIDDHDFSIQAIEETVDYNDGFLGGVQQGDTVALHWNQIIKKLTQEEVKKLEFWTEEIINSLR